MATFEQDVLLVSKSSGNQTLHFPITHLRNVDDTADVKDALDEDDYIPLMDSADSGQMKKILASALPSGTKVIVSAEPPEMDSNTFWLRPI